MMAKERAPMNRTLTLSQADRDRVARRLITLQAPVELAAIANRTLCQNLFEALPYLPDQFVDLMVIDPPYNRTKHFNGTAFKQKNEAAYQQWLESWLIPLKRLLKPDASLYICSDWETSTILYPILKRHFQVRNRITWEREKGRGAKQNWKNASEDIWFCTQSDTYYFNVEAVKLKRRVMAPYRHANGHPKDWQEQNSEKYRLTHPSNLWTDITVPFWSMPENTDHPTQKPEKLIAKLILASSRPQSVIFDPFLGSGTTSVVAKKLNRTYVGIEQEQEYCCWAERRLELADQDRSIQGYAEGVFWERNSLAEQAKHLSYCQEKG